MTTKLVPRDDVQSAVVASGIIRFDDRLADGTAIGSAAGTRNLILGELPVGALMVAGEVVVTSAWFGPASGTVDVGDNDPTDIDPDRYTPTPLVINTATARRVMTPPVYRTVDPCQLTMELVLTGGGAIAGELVWWFKYVVSNRAHRVYG